MSNKDTMPKKAVRCIWYSILTGAFGLMFTFLLYWAPKKAENLGDIGRWWYVDLIALGCILTLLVVAVTVYTLYRWAWSANNTPKGTE